MNLSLMWTQQLCTHVHMFYCHAAHTARLLDGSVCFTRFLLLMKMFAFSFLWNLPQTSHTSERSDENEAERASDQSSCQRFVLKTRHRHSKRSQVTRGDTCLATWQQTRVYKSSLPCSLYLSHSATHAAVKLCVLLPHLQKSQTKHLIWCRRTFAGHDTQHDTAAR